MKKTIVILVTLLLTLLLFSEVKAAEVKKSIIPVDTCWVLHFNLEKLSSTQFYSLLINDENTGGIRKKNAEFSKQYKIDLLKDISGITIYATRKNEKPVVCFSGKFDQNHLLGLLEKETSHRELSHGKYTIYKWDRSQFGVFANARLTLISENEAAIKTALDVISGKKENIASSDLNKHMEEIPSDAFLMAVVENISSLALGLDKPVILKKTSMALLTVLEEKENLILKLDVTTKSPEDAENMEQIIKGLIALANMHKEEINSELELLEDMKISIDGNEVQIELVYPSKDLVDILSKSGKLSRHLGLKEFYPLT